MKKIKLTLPQCKLECRRCRTKWIQAIPRFDRGHAVMRLGDQYIFVSDDIRYELNEMIPDYEAIFKPQGLLPFPTNCPRCKRDDTVYVVRGLISPPDSGYSELPCVEIESLDLDKTRDGWRLRNRFLHDLRTTANTSA